jgi:hypothetical protein
MNSQKRLQLLGLFLTFQLIIFGCTANKTEDSYQPMNLTEMQGELIGSDPKTITLSLFGNKEPIEGNFTEEVTVVKQDGFKQTLMLTQMNLPDDSVKGIRYRLMFEFDQSIGKWRLVEGGRQFSCRRGENTQAWTINTCP